jgi:hypothetical protein
MHHFGVSFTAARYQIWNGLNRRIGLESLTTDDTRARDEWTAAESFTVDYHPIPNIRPSRAGRFSALVIRAEREGLISSDTAKEWLEADDTELEACRRVLPQLFPAVFS